MPEAIVADGIRHRIESRRFPKVHIVDRRIRIRTEFPFAAVRKTNAIVVERFVREVKDDNHVVARSTLIPAVHRQNFLVIIHMMYVDVLAS